MSVCAGMAFMSIVLPAVALTSRVLLSLPGIGSHVDRIRKGWERGASQDEE